MSKKVIVDFYLLRMALLVLHEAGGESREIANQIDEEVVGFSDSDYSALKEKAGWFDVLEDLIEVAYNLPTKEHYFYLKDELWGKSVDKPTLRETLDLYTCGGNNEQ